MGILGTGNQMQGNALEGLKRAAILDEDVKNQNRQIKAAEKSQKINSTVSGAATGAAVGASSAAMGATFGSWAGPVGAVVGAGVGYLLSEVF